jgi:hypothetical protein
MVDSGATGLAFIDQDFARLHGFLLTPLTPSVAVEVIDGRLISSGKITHLATAHMAIHEHSENLSMLVTQLGHYPLVLGTPWLDLHDVGLRFSSLTVSFGSKYCLDHCAPGVLSVQAISSALPERAVPSIALVSASTYIRLTRQARRKGLQIFSLSIQEVESVLDRTDPHALEDIRRSVPPDYHEFLPLFLPQTHRALSPHRQYDHATMLLDNTSPPFGLLYALSRHEL